MEYRGPGLRMPDFLRDIGESAVSIVVVKDVGVAGKPARAAHHRDAFPLTAAGSPDGGSLRGIKLDVIADEQIEVAVAIIVEKSAARAPADAFIVEAGFASDIGKRAVAVVVKKNVVSPEAAEEVVPSVVVVVADAHSGLPAGARESGFFRDVGEGSVAVVLIEMRSGSLSGGPCSRRNAFRWSNKCRASHHGRNRRKRVPLPLASMM